MAQIIKERDTLLSKRVKEIQSQVTELSAKVDGNTGQLRQVKDDVIGI